MPPNCACIFALFRRSGKNRRGGEDGHRRIGTLCECADRLRSAFPRRSGTLWKRFKRGTILRRTRNFRKIGDKCPRIPIARRGRRCHSSTLSAMVTAPGGMVRPSTPAILRRRHLADALVEHLLHLLTAAVGPLETLRNVSYAAAIEGEPDIVRTSANRRRWPRRAVSTAGQGSRN